MRDLEKAETDNGRVAEEPGEETEAGWKDLNDRVDKEEEIGPEREAELDGQYDEEAEIRKKNEERRQTEELLAEGKSLQGIKDIWKLERYEPEGRVPSRLEPFGNER